MKRNVDGNPEKKEEEGKDKKQNEEDGERGKSGDQEACVGVEGDWVVGFGRRRAACLLSFTILVPIVVCSVTMSFMCYFARKKTRFSDK